MHGHMNVKNCKYYSPCPTLQQKFYPNLRRFLPNSQPLGSFMCRVLLYTTLTKNQTQIIDFTT